MTRLIVWEIVTLILTGLWCLGDLDSPIAAGAMIAAPAVVGLIVWRLSPREGPAAKRAVSTGAAVMVVLLSTLISLYVVQVGSPAMRHARDLRNQIREEERQRQQQQAAKAS
jgi:hypothetical protein